MSVERSRRLAGGELALGLLRSRRAGLPGERGGEEIAAGEHRLALGEMGHRPVEGLRRLGRWFRRRAVPLRPGSAAAVGRHASAVAVRIVLTARLPSGRSGHRIGGKPARVEPELGGLSLPALPERIEVDLALGRAGHERRALREAPRCSCPAVACGDRGVSESTWADGLLFGADGVAVTVSLDRTARDASLATATASSATTVPASMRDAFSVPSCPANVP